MKKSEVMTALSVVGVKALFARLAQKYTGEDGKPVTNSDGTPVFIKRREFSFEKFVAEMEGEQFGTEPFAALEKWLTFDGATKIEDAEKSRADRAAELAKITGDLRSLGF